eukprot:m.378145 g.378145  ORF g.378145 m.378145 type:complete len:170 (+) comp20025_c1_seq1:522-1031(+)
MMEKQEKMLEKLLSQMQGQPQRRPANSTTTKKKDFSFKVLKQQALSMFLQETDHVMIQGQPLDPKHLTWAQLGKAIQNRFLQIMREEANVDWEKARKLSADCWEYARRKASETPEQHAIRKARLNTRNQKQALATTRAKENYDFAILTSERLQFATSLRRSATISNPSP